MPAGLRVNGRVAGPWSKVLPYTKVPGKVDPTPEATKTILLAAIRGPR
jgi:hypothetical protein